MKLPIPLSYNGNLYDEVEIKSPSAWVLADTQKEASNGNPYKSLLTFISGCIESIGKTTEKSLIKIMAGFLSYRSAEYLALKILSLGETDDSIEGMYECSRCGNKIICEKDEESGTDTTDHLSDLQLIITDKNQLLTFEIKDRIVIEDTDKNIVDEISSFGLEFPTLNHCINAYNTYGDKDTMRLQFQIYVQALKEVNKTKIDNKYRNRYGMYIIEHLGKNELKDIKNALNEYGVQNVVSKKCSKCGKIFNVAINTSSFFVSALQQMI